jgi:hypothetical protein
MKTQTKDFPSRGNKTATGFMVTEKRREKTTGRVRISNPKHPQYNEEKSRINGKLMVYGTCDSLARLFNYGVKKVKKEHSVDFGYFKEVYILSDSGRSKLKSMRYDKKMRMGVL